MNIQGSIELYSQMLGTISGQVSIGGLIFNAVQIDESGHIVFTLADNTEVDGGRVRFEFSDFTPEQIALLKGDAFTYADFTPGQIEALKVPFTYADFTPQQIAAITGPQGIKGNNWRGTYNAATPYVVDDVIAYQGSSYICILASTGNLPTNTTYWSLFAQAGSVNETQLATKTDKFMATNLVTNGDFSNGTTGWYALYGTLAVANNTLSQTGIGSNATTYLRTTSTFAFVTGRKYYTKALARVTNSNCLSLQIRTLAGYGDTNITNPIINQWYSRSAIAISGGTGSYYPFEITSTYADSATQNGKVTEVQYVFAIDLTALFGAGNEPTANQMDLLMANFPNSWFDGTTELVNVQQMLNYINDLETELHEKTSYGVITGLVTAQQTVADMTVKVSAGTIYMANGDRFTPSATTSLTVTTADATNPRIDIIYVSSTGVVSYLAGTPNASPTQPATPAGGQLLATILVTAGKTSILTADITQRKKTLFAEDWIYPTMLNGHTSASTKPFRYRKTITGQLELDGKIVCSGTAAVCNFMAGYRVSGSYTDCVCTRAGFGTVKVAQLAVSGDLLILNGVNAETYDLSGIKAYVG